MCSPAKFDGANCHCDNLGLYRILELDLEALALFQGCTRFKGCGPVCLR